MQGGLLIREVESIIAPGMEASLGVDGLGEGIAFAYSHPHEKDP